MTKNPANDWEWNSDAEHAFVKWFQGEYGSYSFRSEWFYDDCEVEDVNTRKDLMYKWIHSSFSYAYQKGFENGTKLNPVEFDGIKTDSLNKIKDKLR